MDEHLVGQTSIYDQLPRARTTDPATSHAAAAALSDKHTIMRTLLLVFHGHPAGLTAEQACTLAGYGPEHGGWKRVSDLKRAGLLFPTGDTMTGQQGRAQQVLAITEKGRAALR